jgi:ABC-type branched-subunit amino acid transport system permease subunit
VPSSLDISFLGSNEIEMELSLTTLINTGFYGWLELIRYCGLGCAGYCMGMMLQERIVATIRLRTYEKWTHNGISWLFIISHIIGGVAGTIVVCSG